MDATRAEVDSPSRWGSEGAARKASWPPVQFRLPEQFPPAQSLLRMLLAMERYSGSAQCASLLRGYPSRHAEVRQGLPPDLGDAGAGGPRGDLGAPGLAAVAAQLAEDAHRPQQDGG